MPFCPKCSKCPQCCDRSSCMGPTSAVLASLARNGCESMGGVHSEGGLYPTFQNETLSYQVTYDSKRLCKPLKEALITLKEKLVVETLVVQSSLACYNHLFLVPKPNNKWRPILDLSQLNRYLSTGTFKMETPETIRISLQKGKWVTPLDLCVLPHPHPSQVSQVYEVLSKQALLFPLVWPQLHWSSQRWSRK